MSSAGIAPAGAPPSPIEDVLPTVLPEAARAARLLFDARFLKWLTARFPTLRLHAVSRPLTERAFLIDVDLGPGNLRLALDPADCPVLAMALSMSDEGAACTLATELLSLTSHELDEADIFATVVHRWLPGRWPASTPSPGAILPAVLSSRGVVCVVDVDGIEPFWLQVEDDRYDSTSGLELPSARWVSGLSLAGRLSFGRRLWPARIVKTLAPGDLLIVGDAGAALPARYLIGMGTIMQAVTEVDVDRDSAELTEDLSIATEKADTGVDLSSSGEVEDLQVPVSFEIDTARVALGELASMAPGYVVELDCPLPQATVRLVCHGQTIGTGQLVAVGRRLGVRITRMGTQRIEAGA